MTTDARPGVLDTRDHHRADIKSFAEQAFAEHRIEHRGEGLWRCSKPGTNIYSFYVACLPGAVLVYGDIGELLLRPYHPNTLGWVRGATSLDYVLGKQPRPHREVFLPGEAWAFIDDLRSEGQAESADAIAQSWNGEDDARMWGEAVYDVLHDPEFPRCTDWAATTLWCFHALQWFRRILACDEQDPAGGSP